MGAMGMPVPTLIPPARRPELVIRPLGDRGRYVVKDPRTGDFFTLGEQERFLLEQLDGRRSGRDVCTAFRHRFGEALTEDEAAEFVELARARGFLQPTDAVSGARAPTAPHPAQSL